MLWQHQLICIERLFCSSPYHFPLDALEEGMVYDVEEAVVSAAEPLHGTLVQEAFQHGRGLHRQRTRDTNRFLEDHLMSDHMSAINYIYI